MIIDVYINILFIKLLLYITYIPLSYIISPPLSYSISQIDGIFYKTKKRMVYWLYIEPFTPQGIT